VRKGLVLWLGLGFMFVATLGVIIGVKEFGGSGKTRGLVVRDESGQAVVVRFERGPELHLENRTEQTIGARRQEYPQQLRVSDTSGSLLWEREVSFSDLSANSFRLIIGPTGLIPTPPQNSG
jgi:hypothetical protein